MHAFVQIIVICGDGDIDIRAPKIAGGAGGHENDRRRAETHLRGTQRDTHWRRRIAAEAHLDGIGQAALHHTRLTARVREDDEIIVVGDVRGDLRHRQRGGIAAAAGDAVIDAAPVHAFSRGVVVATRDDGLRHIPAAVAHVADHGDGLAARRREDTRVSGAKGRAGAVLVDLHAVARDAHCDVSAHRCAGETDCVAVHARLADRGVAGFGHIRGAAGLGDDHAHAAVVVAHIHGHIRRVQRVILRVGAAVRRDDDAVIGSCHSRVLHIAVIHRGDRHRLIRAPIRIREGQRGR